jgi:hypothetical protein
MSDIVERLRQGEDEGVDGWWSVMAEAANEIERLRAENEKLRDALIDAAGELQHAYIMGFTERYRYAARAARNAVAAVRESVDE